MHLNDIYPGTSPKKKVPPFVWPALKVAALFIAVVLISACQNQPEVRVDGTSVVSEDYFGNGAQWDPYPEAYGHWNKPLNQEDWDKLYQRVDMMQPGFIRVMISAGTHYGGNGTYKPNRNLEGLSKILQYCNENDVRVMFGDWGGNMVDPEADTIFKQNLQLAARYLDFLVHEKGFTCIEDYNLVNEPNGKWSSTNGSYSLWARAVEYFHQQMKKNDLTDEVGIAAPDIAIWDTKETWWMDSCKTRLGSMIDLWDIHTYPSKYTVNSGKYSDIIGAYARKRPQDQPIILGEIGFKYIHDKDSLLRKENLRRAKNKKYASQKDANMFVYDHFYGVDMADALMQVANQGYSGCVAWMMDDAMHSKESKYKLKVWGFWNILGKEFFGAEKEKIRPWFYAWSLLSRNMQPGSTIYQTHVEGADRLRSVAVENDGNYMLAVVNADKEARHEVHFQTKDFPLKKARKYVYQKDQMNIGEDGFLKPAKKGVNVTTGLQEVIEPESLVVYTNME